jgi:hypothetical protein
LKYVLTPILPPQSKRLTKSQGSTAVYGITDFFEPFAAGGPEHAMKVEVQQGINMANAAIKTQTLKHYIWSTLPNGSKISNGKYLVPHFEAKNKIDDYIKSKPELFAKTTFLWITFYGTNYVFPMFTPNFVKSSGKYVQLAVTPPTVPIRSIGDVSKNIGFFTSAILAQPQLTQGRFVCAYTEETTIGGMLETWSEVTGKPSVYTQVASLEEFNNVWPNWGHEMGVMMKLWEEVGDKSWSGEDYLTKEDLGIAGEKFSTIAETFKEMDWTAIL